MVANLFLGFHFSHVDRVLLLEISDVGRVFHVWRTWIWCMLFPVTQSW